jgi:hypothetical protein
MRRTALALFVVEPTHLRCGKLGLIQAKSKFRIEASVGGFAGGIAAGCIASPNFPSPSPTRTGLIEPRPSPGPSALSRKAGALFSQRRARARPDHRCVSSAAGAYSSNRRKRSGVIGRALLRC